MDRIRDLASRQRASLSTLSTSRSHRKVNDDHPKSTTSSKSSPSKPIQPSQSSQTAAQAQPTQAQAKSISDPKSSETKKKNRRNKNKEAKQKASVERREADQKLFNLAEAVINQNGVISDTDRDLSLRLSEVARDILEADKYIDRKKQEITEINKKLKAMEENFNEAKKHLEMAQLLASQAIDSGCVEQLKHDMKAQLLKNFDSMINKAETSDIATWSMEKTHAYLKDLLGTHLVNKDILHSPSISQTIVSMAKRFTFHGNYDDEDAMLLFHLANGHDLKEFLRKCHDEDHEAASRYPDDHVYRPRQKTDNDSVSDIGKTVADLIKKYASSLTHEDLIKNYISIADNILDPLPHSKLDELMAETSPVAVTKCVVSGCHCEELEKGEFKKWTTKLHAIVAREQCWGLEADRQPLFETVGDIAVAARNFGIDVILFFEEGGRVPALIFRYREEGHPTKSPEMCMRLQAFAEAFCFRFGTYEDRGKTGYVIMPAYRMRGDSVLIEIHAQVRMRIYEVIQEEVSVIVDGIWGTSVDEDDEKHKDDLVKGLELLATQHYFKRALRFVAQDGSIIDTLKTDVAYMLKHGFLKAAKQEGLVTSRRRSA